MVNVSKLSKKYKYIFLAVIILAGFIAYVMSSTHSPIWYDEAVEYFFSKVMTGKVPGEPGANMYERIIYTFQPPLYNVLMHVWLLLFDSGEFTFRLAGIIVTLIGAVGLYKCIDELCGMAYASLGTLFYIFSSSVAYYALECAEYNLMLCCICWMLYFFVKCMKEKSCGAFIGFFLFACLSVYSQYGAAFPVISLYIVLFANCLKDKKSLKKLLIGSGIVALAAVLPLIYFFMLPQMENQGASSISHMPVFEINPIVDYINSAIYVLRSNFGISNTEWLMYRRNVANGTDLGLLAVFPFLIACAAVVVSIIALFRKNKEYLQYAVICLITYSLYFIAVACSFYAHNVWEPHLGFLNTIRVRYCLFFAPLLVVTLTYGVSEFIKFLKNANYKKVMSVLVIISTTVFCSAEIYVLSLGWVKDDMRGACQAWYDNRGYESVTLIHQYSAVNFQYYLIHNDKYNEKYYDDFIFTDPWIKGAEYDELVEKFDEMGIFEYDELYYVGTCEALYLDNYSMVKEAFAEHGFKVTVLYENHSALLHLEKV